MMTVRHILSARVARPQVEALVRGLVRAGVYMGRSDGALGEAEVESLIESIRRLVRSAVGPDQVDAVASTTRLLDEARVARAALRSGGPDAFLHELSASFTGTFKRDALIVAWRVIAADGVIAEAEARAFRRLSSAMGFAPAETEAIEALAQRTAREAAKGLDTHAIEVVCALLTHGWVPVASDDGWFDAVVAFRAGDAELRLELDALEGALHVGVLDSAGQGARVISLYGAGLEPLLAHLDATKHQLLADPRLLTGLVTLSEALFVVRDGSLVQIKSD